ncbi:DUF7527 domain-containing protein [Halapricum desulfuricans]|nr:hypothetical protein [Halapricum desulfuricans]
MTTRAADRVDEWESRPFTDGYEQLRTLADRSFSGAVTAGRATLYLINGTAVDVLGGSIEDFEDATGTVREAPTPALSLLAVMQERGDDVRAKYYSEETALSEADRKLSDGGFTGYVELSENVLSGDYYVLYQGGKSMSVAFLGESERLVYGEDAFERADEEVGIYKVYPVSIDPIEIPEPEEPESDPPSGTGEEPQSETDASDSATADPSHAADADADADSAGSQAETSATADSRDAEPATDTVPADELSADTGRSAETDSSASASDAGESAASTGDADRTEMSEDADSVHRGGRGTDTVPRERTDPPETTRDTPTTRDDDVARDAPTTRDDDVARDAPAARDDASERGQPSRSQDESTRDYPSERAQAPSEREEGRRREQSGGDRRPDTPSRESGSRRDRQPRDADAAITEHVDDAAGGSDDRDGGSSDTSLERRVIPSVDPGRTWTPEDDHTGTDPEYEQPAGATGDRRTNSESSARSAANRSASTRSPAGSQPAQSEDTRAEIADLQQRIDELEAERGDLEAERDELQAQLEQVRDERDDLREEVQTLREQVATLEDRLEAQTTSSEAGSPPSGSDTSSGQSLTPQEAIAGTNLFVRYGSKSGATLSAAHDGDADATAVNDNLSLEYHTEFDDATATVDGEPYESFLEGTIHYRFVAWLVEDLLYAVRDTGHRSSLADLYDAIPRIDRVQFAGTVSADADAEDGDSRADTSFDVVVRDRMGNPLIVTNLNDSRSATTEGMMTDLVTAARQVGDIHERLAGAFFVTSSFFDPDALETAAEATGGGLLSRDKRESFVRLSRKDGFHLCLVESRDDDFHLSVPEL